MFPPNECSGCGACVHICPTHAIEFVRNAEGFYYPSVDENTCVHCGLCEKKCPVLKPLPPITSQPMAYASQNRDEQIRSRSSSGGIFTLLAEYVIRQGGIVVGCAMSPDCYAAEHRVIADESGLRELRGSKYVQSRADITFPTVKEALQNGRTVLFSGTPCQLTGLHAYLSNTDTERLISVDIICHGAPSPAVWEEYVRHWETVKGSKVVSVQFRNKEKGWTPYTLVLTFENGEEYKQVCTEDLYCKGFVADYFLRSSCYDCHAKGDHRSADITLGDLWGIRGVCPSMDDNRGTSLALLNTKKGEELFRMVSSEMTWQSVDRDEALKHNPSYRRSSPKKAYRDHFMKRLHKKPVVKLLASYCSTRLPARIKRKLIGLKAR